MAEFKNWSIWLENITNDLYNLTEKMNSNLDCKEQLKLRNEYIRRCDEWLRVNSIMKDKIKYGRDRAYKQTETLEHDTITISSLY